MMAWNGRSPWHSIRFYPNSSHAYKSFLRGGLPASRHETDNLKQSYTLSGGQEQN